MKKRKTKNRILTILLTLCVIIAMTPAIATAAVPTEVAQLIKYQTKEEKDVRLVAYVDALENYESISFTLTIDGNTTKELVCTTAYDGLYADGVPYTTQQIYGVEGYFVTYTINGYLTSAYAGKEVTITVKYVTVDGEVSTASRTDIIGQAEVETAPLTVTADLTYANKYDWTNTTGQIYVFASSDATATPYSLHGQSSSFLGWWNGVVFDYNSANDTWEVTEVCAADGTNEAESATLGDGRMVVVFSNQAKVSQTKAYNFFKNYAKVGEEFKLNVDIATLQSASREITDVTLSYTYDAPVNEGRITEADIPNGLAVYKSSDEPLKVVQFADLHFGTEGKNYHNNREERTKEYMQYVVDTQKPNLIVCSGDNIMTTGTEGLQEFIEIMESLKTPWTFIYGNHDAESTADGYSKESLSEYMENCDARYLLFDRGYVDTDNNRYGNFSILVLNHNGTELLGAIILMDGGAYNSSISSYDSITKGQIAWYESEIDELNALYSGDGTMPSVVFSHIQLPEYYTAYKAALAGNGANFIIKQELSNASIESIRSGGPTYENTGFFTTMKEKESSVAFFCGHEHLTNFQVEMDGIVLGFGPQSGFSTLFENNDLLRESYMYCFEENFEFTTISCKEDGSNVGLAYSGAFDADATYNATSGTYTATHTFNSGNNITFSYNGERLTTENTQIIGDFSTATSFNGAGGFYSTNGKMLYYNGTSAGTCTFTYDTDAKTLTIEAEEVEADPDAPTSVTFSTTNSDAGADSIALWTTAGTELKSITDTSTGTGSWIGNGWRYYIVVDSEGRIAYAVLWPLSGYGGPMGTTYYVNPYYTDYTKNPAISLLDGFANDWASGGIGYNLFEIVVPEGGFAITSHGTANYDLIDMLSQGTVEDYGVANVNTRSIFKSNIRVTYDLEEGTISIYTE